jgi:hypothetical protein
MPETITTPDFEQIAKQLTKEGAVHSDEDSRLWLRAEIVKQLRLVWNARGAADIAQIEIELDGETFTGDLTLALRGLDL